MWSAHAAYLFRWRCCWRKLVKLRVSHFCDFLQSLCYLTRGLTFFSPAVILSRFEGKAVFRCIFIGFTLTSFLFVFSAFQSSLILPRASLYDFFPPFFLLIKLLCRAKKVYDNDTKTQCNFVVAEVVLQWTCIAYQFMSDVQYNRCFCTLQRTNVYACASECFNKLKEIREGRHHFNLFFLSSCRVDSEVKVTFFSLVTSINEAYLHRHPAALLHSSHIGWIAKIPFFLQQTHLFFRACHLIHIFRGGLNENSCDCDRQAHIETCGLWVSDSK